MGTVPKEIHPEIWIQYTIPIHSHFWRLGDVGTVPKDIHTEIETQYTTPVHSHFWGCGDSAHVYTYGDRDTIYHPYTLSFSETRRRRDSTRGYTYGDRDTIYHLYTLSFLTFGDVETVPTDIDMDKEA